jgi:LysM repeat protein
MFSKFALAAAVLSVFQSVVAETCSRQYTIMDGDTCDGISAAQNVSTYQLATVNAGTINSDCTNLQPSTTICLGWEGEDCNTTYVVVAQDTCDSVTAAFNINSTLLYGNNPQIDQACDNIYVGEVLCVASTIQAPPAGSAPVDTAIPSTATALRPPLPLALRLALALATTVMTVTMATMATTTTCHSATSFRCTSSIFHTIPAPFSPPDDYGFIPSQIQLYFQSLIRVPASSV